MDSLIQLLAKCIQTRLMLLVARLTGQSEGVSLRPLCSKKDLVLHFFLKEETEINQHYNELSIGVQRHVCRPTVATVKPNKVLVPNADFINHSIKATNRRWFLKQLIDFLDPFGQNYQKI